MDLEINTIRTTYKISDKRISVVVYDSVPGGAGYAVRLFKEITMKKLLKAAVIRLDCPSDCSSGCRRCLCDYSNQRIWDYFNRKPVMEWLQSLIHDRVKHPIISLGGSLWEKPNLKILSEKLSQYNEFYVFGRDLAATQTINNPSVQWIMKQLNEGKRIKILLTNKIDRQNIKTHQQRQIFNFISPYIENGQLSLEKISLPDTQEFPIILAGPILNSPGWYSDFLPPAIMDQILPQPIYELITKKAEYIKIQKALDTCKPYEYTFLFPPEQDFQRWKLIAGQPRNLKIYFKSLKNLYIDKLKIKDPYCGAGNRQITSLVNFLQFLIKFTAKINTVTIKCKEQNYHNNNYKSPGLMKSDLIKQIKNNLNINPIINIMPFFQGKTFHDRSIEATAIDNQGESVKHLFDLSGGIDFMIEKDKNCIIFYSKNHK